MISEIDEWVREDNFPINNKKKFNKENSSITEEKSVKERTKGVLKFVEKEFAFKIKERKNFFKLSKCNSNMFRLWIMSLFRVLITCDDKVKQVPWANFAWNYFYLLVFSTLVSKHVLVVS